MRTVLVQVAWGVADAHHPQHDPRRHRQPSGPATPQRAVWPSGQVTREQQLDVISRTFHGSL
ncbi:hypothetical protein [Streptomyces canus]|uniref:hypothetical protein n=1 Tax=Streptomyces canus TaxID=58343 RepID=UPI0027886DA3|nr:hypothetical protein [Streptomyces canus]MDQ0757831.1 autonomous glycyl radical cofactor GrcA [Streptomyces canus]MDQ1073329.1 autonomous glycyl radical cofactor GrcA [Streptomyces canus]